MLSYFAMEFLSMNLRRVSKHTAAVTLDLYFPFLQFPFSIFFFFFFCSYGAIRSGYGQHFGPQGGQDSGFPSPRSALGYPFPAMQNSYSSYHLGGYAPPCASPPKDGE